MSFIGTVATVIHRVTKLVAVDAAVVVTAETEWSFTLNVHCRDTKATEKNHEILFHTHSPLLRF